MPPSIQVNNVGKAVGPLEPLNAAAADGDIFRVK